MSLTKDVMRFVMTTRDNLESDPHVGHLVRELEKKEALFSQEQRVALDPKTLLVVDKLTGKTIIFDEKARRPLYGKPGPKNW